jgi:hypothetical protein
MTTCSMRLSAEAIFAAAASASSASSDDVVRRHSDVRGAVFEQSQHGPEDAAHGVDLDPVVVEVAGEREVVPEQLVGTVDEVNAHPPKLSGGRRTLAC